MENVIGQIVKKRDCALKTTTLFKKVRRVTNMPITKNGQTNCLMKVGSNVDKTNKNKFHQLRRQQKND